MEEAEATRSGRRPKLLPYHDQSRQTCLDAGPQAPCPYFYPRRTPNMFQPFQITLIILTVLPTLGLVWKQCVLYSRRKKENPKSHPKP